MEVLLYAVRFIQYGAAIQLFGLAAFQSLVAPAALRDDLRGPAWRIAGASAAVLLVSAIAWLLLEAGNMGGGWSDAVNPRVIGLVLTATGFGQAWGPRLILCVAIVLAIGGRVTRRWGLLVVLSGLALGSIGLVGHAAMEAGTTGLSARASHVIHLLSAGFWLGSLVPLLLTIRGLGGAGQAGDATLALRRFSGAGHVAVALLLVTGVLNAWWIVGLRIELGSPYQQMLFAKLVIVVVMVVLAGINRYRVLPRIPADASGARELGRNIMAEMGLGGAVIALVSVLGTMAPG